MMYDWNAPTSLTDFDQAELHEHPGSPTTDAVDSELEAAIEYKLAISGFGAAGPTDAETDEAIADIDRAVRVGIYAISRFRDIAEALAGDEASQSR